MRIKFLSVIASFIFVSFVISSCLDDDKTYEYSSDANIHTFSIDTIHGIDYTFTIDQVNRLVYNRDSLPVGADTIIDKILITSFNVSGWVTAGINDTLFNASDSVDLRPAMNNNEGMKFKVHAADGYTMREYTLKVNVHLQDPDSLMWHQMMDNTFTGTVNQDEQKAVILNGNLSVFTSPTTVYTTSTVPGNYNWTLTAVNGLPADIKLSTITTYNDAFYAVSANGKVYTSVNGTDWSFVPSLGNKVVNLINGFTDRLTGITETDGKLYFAITKDGLSWEENSVSSEEIPEEFPLEQLVSTPFITGNGTEMVVLTGMPLANTELTVPWFSLDGFAWANMANSDYDMDCPGMTNPFIMYYANKFYCFGGELDAIYSSITGIAWEKETKKFLLPEVFKGKGNYSIIMEPTMGSDIAPEERRDFIWVVFGGNGTPNEVWRGRLNKLGFTIQ